MLTLKPVTVEMAYVRSLSDLYARHPRHEEPQPVAMRSTEVILSGVVAAGVFCGSYLQTRMQGHLLKVRLRRHGDERDQRERDESRRRR